MSLKSFTLIRETDHAGRPRLRLYRRRQTRDADGVPPRVFGQPGQLRESYPISSRTPVIALDYPGYYLSEKKDAPYDIPFMARAVAELLDKLNLKKAVLVGSSMGGDCAGAPC